jgi:hypothetical protein
VDEKYWLPKGSDIITPQRAAMAGIKAEYDADGVLKHAHIPHQKTVLNYLHESGILDDQEYYDGKSYLIWRELFRAFSNNQRLTYGYSPEKSSKEGNGNRETGYLIVIRNLPKSYQGAVNYAVDTQITPLASKMAHKQQEGFQRAFNRLAAVMEMAREELNNNG